MIFPAITEPSFSPGIFHPATFDDTRGYSSEPRDETTMEAQVMWRAFGPIWFQPEQWTAAWLVWSCWHWDGFSDGDLHGLVRFLKVLQRSTKYLSCWHALLGHSLSHSCFGGLPIPYQCGSLPTATPTLISTTKECGVCAIEHPDPRRKSDGSMQTQGGKQHETHF